MKTSRLALGANPCGATHPCASASTRPAPSGRGLSHLAAAILCLALIGLGQATIAGTVNLQWDANPEPDIAAYNLCYGTSPGNYSTTLSAGTATGITVDGLTEGQTYYFVTKAINAAGIESAPSSEVSYQVPLAGTNTGTTTNVSSYGWKIVSVSSQETVGEYAVGAYAIDGNPATFWHSQWAPTTTPPPHEIQIDLGKIQPIQGFCYLPRQDGLLNGTFTRYEFYTSEDGASWGLPASAGQLAATNSMKQVTFASRNARFIRFRGLEEATGWGWGNIAELKIIAGDTSTTTPPTPENQSPMASGQLIGTQEDNAVAITLSASDADGHALSYRVVSSPGMGTLSGVAPNLVYTPKANANGIDSFSFVANDGYSDSNAATVSIKVIPVNDAPVALAQATSTPEDKALGIFLSANDNDGDMLSYRLVSAPSKGTLSGIAPNLTYIPHSNATGQDSFAFLAYDGTSDSSTATVSISITPVNDEPVAAAKLIAATAGIPVGIVLSANDPDGDPLSFSIVGAPSQGSLTGNPPNLTYTANTDASGTDLLTFRANDGKVNSNTATIAISISAAEKTENKAPVFQSDLITRASGITGDAYVAESLAGSAVDPDGDAVSYSKVSGPEWLSIAPDGGISGTPPSGAEGLNSFAIRSIDPDGAFDEAVLEITILAAELPLPWNLARIGAVTENSTAWGDSGFLKVKSTGSLSGSNDDGLFLWQTLGQDGSIIARIDSLQNSSGSSRIGLEIRESLAPNSRHVFIGTDGSGLLRFVRRTKTGGTTATSSVGFGMTPNLWLRLARNGDSILASTSTDGSNWIRVGKINITLEPYAYVGLMTCGGKDNLISAVFGDVSTTP